MKPAQIELLESLLGNEGIYSETVLEEQLTPYDIRLFYLYRALYEPTKVFLSSLDKLYNPRLENLELIRCLKHINDLANNAEVRNGDFGNSQALSHFLGRLGDVSCEKAFIAKIRELVMVHINSAVTNDYTLMDKASRRYRVEDYIDPLPQWRLLVDLPESQQTISQQYNWQQFYTSVKGAATTAFEFFQAYQEAIYPPPFDQIEDEPENIIDL